MARQAFRWLMYALVATACLYFVLSFRAHAAKLPALQLDARTTLTALLSTLGIVITHLSGTQVWRLLMAEQGHALGMREALQIFYISQIGKYLPGNIGQFVGRGVLARSAGIPMGISVGSAVFEAIWNLVISLALSLLSTWVLWDLSTDPSGNAQFARQAGWMLALFLALPWLSIQTLNHWFPSVSTRLGAGQLLRAPGLATALPVSALILANFLILGTILKWQAEVFFHHPGLDWLSVTLLFATAWVAGYIVPGAPGGLGVREAMMVLLFTPLTGAATAGGLAVSMRLTTLLGDGLTFVLGLLSQRLQRGKPPAPGTLKPAHTRPH